MGYTSAERVLAVLNGEIPDRTPVFEYLIHEGVFNRLGFGGIQAGDTETYLAACSKCLDLCHPSVGAPFTPGEKIREDGSKSVIERWMTWEVPPAAEYFTADATLRRLKLDIEKLEEERAAPDYRALLAEKKRRDAFTDGMVYIELGASCALPYNNTERSIYLYADHPELVEYKMALENRRTLEKLQAIAFPELSPVAIIWDDIAYKDALFYPPDILERLFYPALCEMCELLHSRGVKVIFHSDGDNSKAMPALAECGIDGFNPLEITAGMDYDTFKKDYGGRVAIVGGLDAVGVLALGSVDDVVAATKRLIDIGGRNGGLIAASASGQIDDGMPVENVMAYFETIRE
jgi:hypothetical protein